MFTNSHNAFPSYDTLFRSLYLLFAALVAFSKFWTHFRRPVRVFNYYQLPASSTTCSDTSPVTVNHLEPLQRVLSQLHPFSAIFKVLHAFSNACTRFGPQSTTLEPYCTFIHVSGYRQRVYTSFSHFWTLYTHFRVFSSFWTHFWTLVCVFNCCRPLVSSTTCFDTFFGHCRPFRRW